MRTREWEPNINIPLCLSLSPKCHAERKHFISPAHRNLCAWQIEQEIKRIQSIQLSNTYLGWWFKLQSLKNLAPSKLKPCPGFFFFSSIISSEKVEKINIFPVTQQINNICTLNEFKMLLEWKVFPFQHASVEEKSCRDWSVWFHCKVAGRHQWQDWHCINLQAHGPSNPTPPWDILAMDLRSIGIISVLKTWRQGLTWTAGEVKHFTALIKHTFLWH